MVVSAGLVGRKSAPFVLGCSVSHVISYSKFSYVGSVLSYRKFSYVGFVTYRQFMIQGQTLGTTCFVFDFGHGKDRNDAKSRSEPPRKRVLGKNVPREFVIQFQTGVDSCAQIHLSGGYSSSAVRSFERIRA